MESGSVVMAAFIVLGWAAFVGMTSPEPLQGAQTTESPMIQVYALEERVPPLESLTAYISAYTCQPVAANPMNPCNTTRWGSDPFTHGAACPESWAWRRVLVEGVWYDCDDTPRHSFIDGLPHIDLRLPTYTAAVRWGIQIIDIEVSK
jgi:hypothetical protein